MQLKLALFSMLHCALSSALIVAVSREGDGTRKCGSTRDVDGRTRRGRRGTGRRPQFVRPSARFHISQLTYGNVFPRCSREQREGGEEREGRWAVGGNGRGGARETGDERGRLDCQLSSLLGR